MFQGSLVLQIHVAVGIALVVASLFLIGLALTAGQGLWLALSLPGWIGIMGAAFNGASLINYGHDFSSLLMSIGFIVAAVSYLVGLVVIR